MTAAIEVPEGPAEITPVWLTAALRAGGALPAGAVEAVSTETIGEERGFTGVVARVQPSYQDADTDPPPPASIVAKLPTATRTAASAYRSAQQRDGDAAYQHYQRSAREVAFYRELAAGEAWLPRLYYAGTDPERQRIVMLLEDLSAWRPGDELAGATASEAATILDAIAPLHARMWQRRPAAWVPDWVTDYQASQQRYATRVAPFLEQYGDRLPPPVRELVNRLRTGYAMVLGQLHEAPPTVMHGDLHLDNVLFAPPRNGRPTIILDWQGVRWGPAAMDVAAVIFGSLPPAERRASERDLLRGYAERLRAHGVADYPVDRLLRDCRLALLVKVAGRVGWLATADPDDLSDRERALNDAAFGDGRLTTALLDHHLA